MAAISTLIAGAGLALGAFGAYQSYKSSQQANASQQQAIVAQQEAEALRKQQMDLDATRRRREILRQSVAARSASLAVTTAQGAAYEGGSALPGAYGSISGRTNVNLAGINQNQELGGGIFEAHSNQLTAYKNAANYQSQASMWQGVSSLGGSLLNNAGTIGQIGTYAGTSFGNQVGSFLAPKGGFTGFTSYYR